MCPSCRRPVLFMEGTGCLRVGRGWLGSGSHCVSWKGVLVCRESGCVFPGMQKDGGVPPWVLPGPSPPCLLRELTDGGPGGGCWCGFIDSGGAAACGRDLEREPGQGQDRDRGLCGG